MFGRKSIILESYKILKKLQNEGYIHSLENKDNQNNRLIFNSTEEIIAETDMNALYTLTIRNENLITITNSNSIRRFDINTGRRISDTKTIIEGWITAIAPYY